MIINKLCVTTQLNFRNKRRMTVTCISYLLGERDNMAEAQRACMCAHIHTHRVYKNIHKWKGEKSNRAQPAMSLQWAIQHTKDRHEKAKQIHDIKPATQKKKKKVEGTCTRWDEEGNVITTCARSGSHK